jgi:hypothetical protein
MTVFDQIVVKIVQEQELVIGPLAWTEASKVSGLQVDTTQHKATLTDANQKEVIDRLVARYERLFGRASQEVCREAAANLIASLSPSEIPSSLVA